MEFFTDTNVLIALLVVVSAIAAAGLVMLYLFWRKQEQPEESIVVTSEWQPTGKIDFYCPEIPQDDKAPAPFLLRVEEYRTVERSEEHTSELQSPDHLVCRLLLEKKKKSNNRKKIQNNNHK